MVAGAAPSLDANLSLALASRSRALVTLEPLPMSMILSCLLRATHMDGRTTARPSVYLSLVNEDGGMTFAQLKSHLLDQWRCLAERDDVDPPYECAKSESISRRLFASRLPSIRLNQCVVSESNLPGAGRGVFACQPIMAGTVATLYPGDALRWSQKSLEEDMAWTLTDIDASFQPASAELLARGRDYEMEVCSAAASDPMSIIGDPSRADDAAYLGHMINDGAFCTSESLRAEYKLKSQAMRNAEQVDLVGCHTAIVATRDIQVGEELLLTYGANYWIGRLAPSSMTPVYCTSAISEEDDESTIRLLSSHGSRMQHRQLPQQAKRADRRKKKPWTRSRSLRMVDLPETRGTPQRYLHGLHAGCFQDIVKHCVLIKLLQRMCDKPTPFTYVETHSGAGRYSIDATLPHEAAAGIKLLQAWAASHDDSAARMPAEAQTLLKLINTPDNTMQLYPGSPWIAMSHCRSQLDSLHLCELEDDQHTLLRETVDAHCNMCSVETHQCDGFATLRKTKSGVLTPGRRGLIFMDPPYSHAGSDTQRAMAAAGHLEKHWRSARLCLWYPATWKHSKVRDEFLGAGVRGECLAAELIKGGPESKGSGMLLIHPPFGIKRELQELLEFLARALQQPDEEPPVVRVEWVNK